MALLVIKTATYHSLVGYGRCVAAGWAMSLLDTFFPFEYHQSYERLE
jgi:hypothetical protein